MQTDNLINWIRDRARKLGLSKSRLAIMADLHKNTLRHFDKPHWSPKLKTLQKLEAALKRATPKSE